jgi:hypothetical protein
MHIVVFILAALLLLFGGGCTLVFLVSTIEDPRAMYVDIGAVVAIWLPLGLGPLAAGIALWRVALNMKRKRDSGLTKGIEEKGQ